MRLLLARIRAWKAPFRRPTKKELISGALAAGMALGGLLGLGPLVRQRVEQLADRYQVAIEVGHVWPAFGGVRLDAVQVHATSEGSRAPWLAMNLDEVVVRFGWSFDLRSVVVRGGRVELAGASEDVLQRARELGQRSGPQAPSEGARRRPLELSVSGVTLSWPGALDPESVVEVVGLRFERAAVQDESDGAQGPPVGLVGFASARVTYGPGSLSASGAEARFSRVKGETVWTGGRIAQLDGAISLDARSTLPVVPPNSPRPATRDARAAGGSTSRLAGDVRELATRVREQAERAAAWSGEHLLRSGIYEVGGLTVSLTHGADTLHLGPGRLKISPSPEGLGVSFLPGEIAQSDGATLRVRALLPRSGDLVADVEGGPMTLASLGVHEGNFGLVDVQNAKLRAKMSLALRGEGTRFTFDGDGQLSPLSVVHRALADDPVRGLDLGWSAAGVYQVDGSLLRIDDLRLALGAIVVRGSGVVTQGSDYVKVEAHASVPQSDCQQMFASLPTALVPKLTGTRMAGTVALRTGLILDTRRPDDMDVEWDLKNQCRITDVPSGIDVKRFADPFVHTVYDEHGKTVEITTGPGTPDWVPLHAMSPFLEAAITTTEDGGFRSHGGFDKGAIRNSIRDNLRAGRFLRGASTISMQLSKNLYLAREKNLSRKLQEAILTTYLEQSLSKDEILELYFNIVEFGPMIYGVGAAADHYFDTSSSDLSLGQALFLTSILPAPKRTYFTAGGQLAKGWQSYLHRLMHIMRARNKINDDELNDGLSEVITYGVARSPRVRASRESGADTGAFDWSPPDGP